MECYQLRFASKQDAPRLLKIYRPYVEDTDITFEYEVPTVAEFAQRIEEITSFYPYLVCEQNGRIIGYAYAHRQAERAAYQWNAELSVYLDTACLQKGIGKVLYGALIELVRLQHVCNVYGCITSPNPRSERLHEKMGFRRIGVFHDTGYKLGCWHDVVWYEKCIVNPALPPEPLLNISKVDPQIVAEVLQRFTRQLG